MRCGAILFFVVSVLAGQSGSQPDAAEARRLFSTGQFDASAKAWQRVLAKSPADVDALLGYGVALDALGRYQDARTNLEAARKLNPTSTSALNNLAITLVHLGLVSDALDIFAETLRLEPNNLNALFNAGSIYAAQRKWANAIDLLAKALQLSPSDAAIRSALASAHTSYGRALLSNAKLDDSLAQFDAAIDVNPEDAEPYLGASLALIQGNAPDKAELLLTEANRKLPANPRLMIAEGYALEAETRWEAAAEWYRKAIAVDHTVIPLVLLGRCLRSGGHADEGLAKLREAAKQDPKSLFASFELGKALLADRPDDPEGGTLMQRVAQGEPKSWEPKYFLAKVAFAEGNSDQAAEQARAAIQANPNQASPHYLLWQILKKRGETSQAEIELAKFRQLQSQTYAQATEDLKRVFAQ